MPDDQWGKRTFPCPALQGKFISEEERRDISFGHLIIFVHEKGGFKFLKVVPVVRRSFRKDGLVDIMKAVTNPKCTFFLR